MRVDEEELRDQLADEVLKRDVIEGDKADDARKRIAKAQGRALRALKQLQEQAALIWRTLAGRKMGPRVEVPLP